MKDNLKVFSANIVPASQTLTLADGSTYATTGNGVSFSGTAISLILDCSQCTGAMTARFNGLTTAQFPLNKGLAYAWGNGDIHCTSLAFSNSSGSSQVVSYWAGVVQTS